MLSFDALNASLSGSKLMWGVAAIVANMGSRFIIGELTPAQQGVLRNPAFKRVALFCMIFMPTRDVLLSVALTVVVSALLEGLLNEGSRYCVLPECLRRASAELAAGGAPVGLPVATRAPVLGLFSFGAGRMPAAAARMPVAAPLVAAVRDGGDAWGGLGGSEWGL
jgi:hypothetical protein